MVSIKKQQPFYKIECGYEVGYFNGINGAGNIKVLPIIDKNNYEVLDFPGHEYLELYSKEVINFENLRLLKRIDEAKL